MSLPSQPFASPASPSNAGWGASATEGELRGDRLVHAALALALGHLAFGDEAEARAAADSGRVELAGHAFTFVLDERSGDIEIGCTALACLPDGDAMRRMLAWALSATEDALDIGIDSRTGRAMLRQRVPTWLLDGAEAEFAREIAQRLIGLCRACTEPAAERAHG